MAGGQRTRRQTAEQSTVADALDIGADRRQLFLQPLVAAVEMVDALDVGFSFGDQPCMHEALFDDSFLEGSGVSTLDFAKAMRPEVSRRIPA